MQVICFSTRGQDRLALQRGAILCTSNGKPSSGVSWSEGSQQTARKQGETDFGALGTQQANETRISQMRTALDATPQPVELATYPQHQSECIKALRARSPEQIDQKTLATLKARAALAGYTCAIDEVGGVILARWDRSIDFSGIAAASAWIDGLTGQKGGS